MLNDFEWSIMQATYAAEVSGSGVAPRERVKAKVWPTAEAALALARRQAGASEDAPVSDAQSRRGSRKKSVGFEDSSKQASDALAEQSARETLQKRASCGRVCRMLSQCTSQS